MKWYHYIGFAVLAVLCPLGFDLYALYAVSVVRVGREMTKKLGKSV